MELVSRYLQEIQTVLLRMPEKQIANVVTLLYQACKARKRVFILGNGGSAATASHLTNDLSKATIVPGKPRLKVIALTDNIALITAWANDTSYEMVFKEQLENLLESGDVVIGLSASGNSPNVLRAMEFARKHGAVTIGWTGLTGGRLKDIVEHCVHSPTDDVGMIESSHLVLDHLVTDGLQQLLRREASSELSAGVRPAVNGPGRRTQGKTADLERRRSSRARRGSAGPE